MSAQSAQKRASKEKSRAFKLNFCRCKFYTTTYHVRNLGLALLGNEQPGDAN